MIDHLLRAGVIEQSKGNVVRKVVRWLRVLKQKLRSIASLFAHDDDFCAIAGAQGDAFLLRRGYQSFLIDGGKDGGAVTRKILENSDSVTLDVIVCTHADEDHAGGLVSILKEENITVCEVWLPASWLGVLAYKRSGKEGWEAIREMLAKRYLFENKSDPLELDISEADENNAAKIIEERLIKPLQKRGLSQREIDDLIRTGKSVFDRITALYELAETRNCTIRWFSYEDWMGGCSPRGGRRGVLVPVNAVEITSVSEASIINIFYREFHRQHLLIKTNLNFITDCFLPLLYLTTVNRHALVFWSPPTRRAPPILFCSDWGFRPANPPRSQFIPDVSKTWEPKEAMIATAPHHGSNDIENVAVYREIDTWHGNPTEITWVRSDSTYKKRPGKEFRSKDHRMCTNCHGRQKQTDIHLIGRNGRWMPDVYLHCPDHPHCK